VSSHRKVSHPFSRAAKRLRELERIIKDRGGMVPATDDAEVYLTPVAQCFRRITADRGKPLSEDDLADRLAFWCERWAPHITEDRGVDIVRRVLAQGPTLMADDILGAKLRLSYADRQRLKITAIGSYDVDRRARKRLARAKRKERNRLYAAEKRRLSGAVSHSESLSRTRPWEQMGISRAKYYRLPPDQRIETNSSPHPFFVSKGDETVSRSQSNARSSLTPDRIRQTKPPAIAFGTTNQESIELSMVAGEACEAGGGNPDRDRQRKTRFPTAMRLNKEQLEYAREVGFTPAEIENLLGIFRNHSLACRAYSADWDAAWFNFVDRQVQYEDERYWRERERAYRERRRSA
jgi:hypothetical protein